MRASRTLQAWQVPAQWPGTTARPESSAAGALKVCLVLCVASLTVLDRFGLKLSESYSAPPTLIAMYALVAVMAVAGWLKINPAGALTVAATGAVAALSFVINDVFGYAQNVSGTSLALLLVIYALFAVSVRPAVDASALWRWTVKMYIGFAILVAVAGIAQFFAQFFVEPAWLFDFRPFLPEAIRGSGVFNTVNTLSAGWTKSNGFFLREASMLSMQMAMALILELGAGRRKWVLGLLGAALLLTYSGSGLMVLAIAMLFPLGQRSLWQVTAALTLAVLVFVVAGEALNLSYTVGRIEEFQSERSSGYCRFVQPWLIVLEYLDAPYWASLIGHGPGSITPVENTCAPTFAKVPFEYGLLGTVAFGALILSALNRSSAPIRIRVALFTQWVLQAGLLATDLLLPIFVLCALWPRDAAGGPPPGRAAGERQG